MYNNEQIESKKNKRKHLIKFLNSLKFDGTDRITDIRIRDSLVVIQDLMGIDIDNQIVTVDPEIVLISSWRSEKVNPELSKAIQRDSQRMANKINKEKNELTKGG